MSYLHDRKKDQRRKRFLIGFFCAIILVILSLLGVFKSFSKVFHFIARPLWEANTTIATDVEKIGYVVRTKASVYKENDALIEENNRLKGQLLDHDVLLKENTDLKALFDRIPAKENFILGVILAKPNRSPYDTLILDIGSADGAFVGQEVYASAVVPIGTLSSVYAHTSVVKLYSTPNETTPAQIEGSNASVELVGRGGGNFEMMIPKDLEVPTGTNIILPHIQSKIVAIVVERISDPRDPVNKVLLRSPINVQELKWVEVKK